MFEHEDESAESPSDDDNARKPHRQSADYTATWTPAAPPTPCPDSHGRGSIELLISTEPCPRCHGSGSLPAAPDTRFCFRYDGDGNLTIFLSPSA